MLQFTAILLSIISISALSAFILTLLTKWGVVEYVQIHGNKFFSKMFSCNFCLSWWINVLLTAVLVALTNGNFELAILPFINTCITKKLLN